MPGLELCVGDRPLPLRFERLRLPEAGPIVSSESDSLATEPRAIERQATCWAGEIGRRARRGGNEV